MGPRPDRGGLRLLVPEQGTGSPEEDGFAQGNADEPFRVRDRIRTADPDLVVVLGSDHVYRFDFLDAVETRRSSGAECTVVTSEVDLAEAADHATVESDADGTVTTSRPTRTCSPTTRASSTTRRGRS